MPKTRAQQNRFIRQEALREQLSAYKHEEKLVEIIEKLSEPSQEIDAEMVTRLRIAADKHLDLLHKYLPNLKQTDSTITMDARVSDATDDEIDARLAAHFAKTGESGGSGASG